MDFASILIVDHDALSRASMAQQLRSTGHRVEAVGDTESARMSLDRRTPDLMLVEWRLPRCPAIELIRDIKRRAQTRAVRIITVSEWDSVDDKVRAFESGVDDFVVKPFAERELLARINASLRRPAVDHVGQILKAGELTLDPVSHRLWHGETPLELAPTEFRLMAFLMANQGPVFERSQLLHHVWAPGVPVGRRAVDVHVRRIRKALEPFGCDKYIQTVRGFGYRFSEQHLT